MSNEQGEYTVTHVADTGWCETPGRQDGSIRSAASETLGQVKQAGLLLTMLTSIAGLFFYFEVSHVLVDRVSPWVIIAIFFAASLSSIAGFAFSAICGAMLFYILGGRYTLSKL